MEIQASDPAFSSGASGHPHAVPDLAFTMPLKVRSYEVTEAGFVGIGVILRYLEHLATTASAARGFDHVWYERSGTAWVVREMDLLLGSLPGIDEELTLATWLSDFRRVQAHREYAIWRAGDQRLVARARARWAYVDRVRGQLTRLPDELVSRFGVAGSPMRRRDLGAPVARDGEASERVSTLDLTARGYECDTQRHVNNTVYADWLTEALERSLSQRMGGPEPARARYRYLHIEYVRPVRAGQRVHITTKVTALGSRGLHSSQTIANTDEQTICVQANMRLLRVGPPTSI